VILGEITWALNYWPLTGWTGGAVLLIAFYLVAGLLLAQCAKVSPPRSPRIRPRRGGHVRDRGRGAWW
jgi:hypothetical protein